LKITYKVYLSSLDPNILDSDLIVTSMLIATAFAMWDSAKVETIACNLLDHYEAFV
jgi:hypothetical protein